MYIRKLKERVICDYDKAIVTTKAGKVRGVISEGTYIFRGIKYAQAQRFQMPKPVTPWRGVKEAIVYGFVCPEIFTPVPHDQYTVPHYFGVQSEDCQYLNVWTQNINSKAKKPVMVWLHGGGFFSGSGVEHYAYDGENLAKFGDVVVVTLNHRLNVLGFLDLSDYDKKYKYSGNVGMADVVIALEWIRDNIEQFGGDPENVMIFGQSGGGAKVSMLMQMPAADGLFHRACMQSGGMSRGQENTQKKAKILTKHLLKYLNISDENISKLERISYDELAEAARFVIKKTDGTPMIWEPVVDNDYYIGHPLSVGFRSENKHIPLMCGTVLGEFSNNYTAPKGVGSKNKWSSEYKKEILQKEYGDKTDEIVKAFTKAYPEKNIVDVLFMDRNGRQSSLEFARERAKFTDAGTYNFIFNLEFPFNGGTLPWHNAEISYVFHNADYIESSYIPGITEKLQEIISGAWINFARNGDPNGGEVPNWPKFNGDGTNTMIFDRETYLGIDHDRELLSKLPDIPMNLMSLIKGNKK